MAVYHGSTSFTPSASTPFSHQVSQASTSSKVVSSLNPSTYKQAVTFTATVTPRFGGTVARTATFQGGTKTLATVTVSRGAAKFTDSTLASGMHNITATYNGSSNLSVSTSALLSQKVN